jgi:hypothetical protein
VQSLFLLTRQRETCLVKNIASRSVERFDLVKTSTTLVPFFLRSTHQRNYDDNRASEKQSSGQHNKIYGRNHKTL